MNKTLQSSMNHLLEQIRSALGLGSLLASGVSGCVESPKWIEVPEAETQADSGTAEDSTENDGASIGEEDDGPSYTLTPDVLPDDCNFKMKDIQPWLPGQCRRVHPVDSPRYHDICFLPPLGVRCEDEPYTRECLLSRYSCGVVNRGNEVHCGPIVQKDSGACCYRVVGQCAAGRPLYVGGQARLAQIVGGTGWSGPTLAGLSDTKIGMQTGLKIRAASLDEDSRRGLSDFWAESGLYEHAAVASFARFVLQLLSLSAPAELVVGAQKAMGDEIEHARQCFYLASIYRGQAIQPSALDVSDSLSEANLSPKEIATSLASEGCIAETVSVMLLIAARDHVLDPEINTILSRMIEQEIEHVVLAWKALVWMLEQDTTDRTVTGAVMRVFANPEEHVGFGAVIHRAEDAINPLSNFGYLALEQREAIASRVLETIVRPLSLTLWGSLNPDNAEISDQLPMRWSSARV